MEQEEGPSRLRAQHVRKERGAWWLVCGAQDGEKV